MSRVVHFPTDEIGNMFCEQQKGNQLAQREKSVNHESIRETCNALGDPSDSMWTQQQQHRAPLLAQIR